MSHYRLVSFLPMALAGWPWQVLQRAVALPGGYVVAGALLLLGVAAYALGRGTPDGSAAYSGTTAEVVGATFRRARPSSRASWPSTCCPGPVRGVGSSRCSSTGRLALTAYTVQILWLALLAALRDNAPPTTRGWVLGSSLVVVVGLCWVLDRRCGTGPLEWVLHRLRPQPPPPGRHLSATAGRE